MISSKDVVTPLALRQRDAAKALGVSERTLARLKSAGRLEFVRVGTAVLFPVEGLKSWLNSQVVSE